MVKSKINKHRTARREIEEQLKNEENRGNISQEFATLLLRVPVLPALQMFIDKLQTECGLLPADT
jgi:hypothetical protein